MVLSWLSRLIASLLVTVLTATIITSVLNQTVLSSHYLEGQLTATDSYSRLSVALSDQVAKSTGSVDPAVNAKVQTILTPAVLKTKLDSALNQLQAYYQGNGPAPVIDFSDLAAQAQAAGIPLGSDSGLTKPITLGGTSANNQIQRSGNNFENLRKLGTLLSVVLAALLVLLCWRRRDYRPLANVLISIGISIGLIALFCHFAPGLINHFVKFNTSSNAFVGVSDDLVAAITRDLAKRFGLIAACLLIVGIGSRLLIRRLTTLKLKAPPTVPPQRASLPR